MNKALERAAAIVEGVFSGAAWGSKGGPGSGNYGHAGRPGSVGGSAPKTGAGAVMSLRSGPTAQARQTEASSLVSATGGKITEQQARAELKKLKLSELRRRARALAPTGAGWPKGKPAYDRANQEMKEAINKARDILKRVGLEGWQLDTVIQNAATFDFTDFD